MARAADRLPAPPGPWNRYACDGRPPGSERRRRARRGHCGWRSSSASTAPMLASAPGMPDTRTADHDRGARRGRQDDPRDRARRTRWPTAASRSRCCASPAACPRPSGSASWSRIRTLRIGARAEALLYAAARAQLVEEALEPLLEAGTWVAARPVRRFLARLPGRRPRARRRRGPGGQPVRDRRPDARTARCCSRLEPALGRARDLARAASRPTGSSSSATSSSQRIAAAYASSPTATRSGSA